MNDKTRKALTFFTAIFLFGQLGACTKSSEAQQKWPVVTVYKSASCGCCKKWVAYLEQNGFEVTATDVADVTPMKDQFGVSVPLRSCHTALVDGYVIDGHVPAFDIKRLLTERPHIDGLAVPGMTMGSPGMEGNRVDHYEVIAFTKDGKQDVYSRY